MQVAARPWQIAHRGHAGHRSDPREVEEVIPWILRAGSCKAPLSQIRTANSSTFVLAKEANSFRKLGNASGVFALQNIERPKDLQDR